MSELTWAYLAWIILVGVVLALAWLYRRDIGASVLGLLRDLEGQRAALEAKDRRNSELMGLVVEQSRALAQVAAEPPGEKRRARAREIAQQLPALAGMPRNGRIPREDEIPLHDPAHELTGMEA